MIIKKEPAKSHFIYDEEDNENYAALIIQRDNPQFNDLVTEFINTVTLLNSKPGTED